MAGRGSRNVDAARALGEITGEFPGYRGSSGVDSVRADGTLRADRALLTKEYPLMKTTHRSLTGAALVLAMAPGMTVSARADEAEDKAVKANRNMGRDITRDKEAKDEPIVSVDMRGANVTDAGLKHLFETIQPSHVSRLAFVYVRQSSSHQSLPPTPVTEINEDFCHVIEAL
jgi:hypothetical protein